MEPVRLGIIGLGVVGRDHLRNALDLAPLIEVIGVADPVPAARVLAEASGVPAVASAEELFGRRPEAVIVATPHPLHEAAVVAAAERGVHVLCEKPLAVSVSAADRMVAACRRHKVTLAIDYQQRLSPVYQTLQRLLAAGEIGEISRVAVVATGWYRTQAYYDSGNWRGTWDGEGGGVLMNQAPHHLDLYVWLCGLPARVKASVSTRIHRIETENTVAAILEHEAGRADTFVTTTAEYPGASTWTFAGDRGTLTCDGKALHLTRLDGSLRHHILTAPTSAKPAVVEEAVALDAPGPDGVGHRGLLARFARAVRGGEPPVATGDDGLRQLELANAMLMAGYRDRAVAIPVDRPAYDALLAELRQREV